MVHDKHGTEKRVSRTLILVRLERSVFRQKLPSFSKSVLPLLAVLYFSTAVLAADGLNPSSDDLDPLPHAQQEDAVLLMKEKKWDEALLKLRAVVKENPNDLSAQIRLSHVLLQMGRREEALSNLAQRLRLISLNPRSREKTHLKFESEKKLLQRQIRVISRLFLSNETFQVYQSGVQQIQLKKYSSAREKLEKAFQAEPDQFDVLIRLAQLDVIDQNYDRASERLKAAHRMNPEEPIARLWLARALFERGERSEALTEFREVAFDLRGNELLVLWWAEAVNAAREHLLKVERGTRAYNVKEIAKENLYSESLALLGKDLKENPLHLAVALMSARFRLLSIGISGDRLAKNSDAITNGSKESSKNLQVLQSIKHDLQQALTRYPDYLELLKKREGMDLDFEVMDPVQIKENIQTLLEQVDAKLMGQSHASSHLVLTTIS